MMTMKPTSWFAVPRITRRMRRGLALILGVPALMLTVALVMTEDESRLERQQFAMLALKEDMRDVPLQNGWWIKNVRLNDKDRIEMDVELGYHYQAEFIKSRNGRIQHSYLKLACPRVGANVFGHMKDLETVWIRLLYKDQVIVTGACPRKGVPFS